MTLPEDSATNILHLSDLHFGWEGQETSLTNRELALSGLLKTMEKLEPEWMPDCLCVTGDIGWKGSKNDYEKAKEWLISLTNKIKIAPDAIFMCPGNHDSNRIFSKRFARPNTPEEADEIFSMEEVPIYLQQCYEQFCSFCQELKIPPYKIGDIESYIYGCRDFNSFTFMSINTAWFSKNDDDRGKLWIGLPLLKHLEVKGNFTAVGNHINKPINIILQHHPKEWLHKAETSSFGNRPNTFDYLCRRSHLILTGHTHGEVRRGDKYAERAWHLSGGAAYNGASHFNSFRIIRLHSNGFKYRSYEFDPRSADLCWTEKGAPSSHVF